MTDNPYSQTPIGSTRKSQPSFFIKWFVAGFLLVFIGMLIFANQYFNNGAVLVRCKQWEFYFLEIRRLFTSPNTLGPTTGASGRALVVFVIHLAISGIGGLVLIGVGIMTKRGRR